MCLAKIFEYLLDLVETWSFLVFAKYLWVMKKRRLEKQFCKSHLSLTWTENQNKLDSCSQCRVSLKLRSFQAKGLISPKEKAYIHNNNCHPVLLLSGSWNWEKPHFNESFWNRLFLNNAVVQASLEITSV